MNPNAGANELMYGGGHTWPGNGFRGVGVGVTPGVLPPCLLFEASTASAVDSVTSLVST